MNHSLAKILLIALLTTAPLAAWAEASAAGANNGTPKTVAGNAAAEKVPDTLMFTIDEFNDIQGHLSGGGTDESGKGSQAIENASLYLSTILYLSPTDWTIWVNGVPIGPTQDFQSFKVTEITPSYVELLVPLSAQGMRPVRLGPNQTFVAKSGVVVEGRIP